MKDDIVRMGNDDPFTQLVWPLSGQDPDDAFSGVPYEKVSYELSFKIEYLLINFLLISF